MNLRLGDEGTEQQGRGRELLVSIPVLVNLRLGDHGRRDPGARERVSIPVLVNLRLGERMICQVFRAVWMSQFLFW